MIKVSIIIPNYNHSSFLKQRIDSVLNQTFQDFELIILDDCSTDNSSKVINSYSNNDKISHIIFNEENSGSPFKQWQKGIELAKGEYVWIAESDDWCEPTLLQDLVEGIEKDKECVISYCQMSCIAGDNKIKWQSHHHSLSDIIDSKTFIHDYLSIKVAIYNASMAIFKRETYKNVTNEFTTFQLSGDRMFWIQVARQGKVHVSGKVLNYFRKHDKDVSGKAYKSGINFIEEFRIINWMYKEDLIDDRIYNLAIRNQFKGYWKVRNRIDPKNKARIQPLFHDLKTKNSTILKYLPTAMWSAWKNKE